MKKFLILIILAVAVSCKAKKENISYADHVSQIDSIVYANRNIDSLTALLAGYEAGNDDVGRMFWQDMKPAMTTWEEWWQ